MIQGRVSVVIPSNNERHLQRTIDSVLREARGDVEVFACLDGLDEQFEQADGSINTTAMDAYIASCAGARVHVLPHRARAHMRPMENEAARLATGEFLMKLDAHCILAPGWDEALKSHCEPGDLLVPTRHSIDEKRWNVAQRDFNYSYLTWPFALSMYGYGLHAKTFNRNRSDDHNARINALRAEYPVDDILSFQGSCWFQRKEDFDRLGPLDHEHYYFYQEAQEVGLRVWMSGGRCRVDKTTWYAHLHKGHDNKGANDRTGRGFFLNVYKKREAERFAADYWLNDRMPGATRTFVQLIEHFQWVNDLIQSRDEQWPADWRNFEKYKERFEARPVDQTPLHT